MNIIIIIFEPSADQMCLMKKELQIQLPTLYSYEYLSLAQAC